MREGIYDLSTDPTTFDFITWSTIARSNGVDHVHFVIDQGIRTDKYDEVTAWKRFGNILVPSTKLSGLTFTVGSKRDGERFGWHIGEVEATYKKTGSINKLKPTAGIGLKNTVSITIRDSIRNKWRDSNKPAWDKFTKHLQSEGYQVIILNDCELNPIDIQWRMAVYSECLMNYGVNSGPMAMCMFSDCPYLIFNMSPKHNDFNMEEHLTKGGFPKNSQLSFRNKKQLIVWEPDDYETILKHHNRLTKTNT
jgi:hypothetical protein